MKKIILILCMSLLVALSGCEKENSSEKIKESPQATIEKETGKNNSEEKENEDKNFDLSELKANDLEGNEVDNSIFKDKYTLVNVWGTFCPPCIEEMPDLKKLYDDYKDQGFNVVGIVADAYQNDDIVKKAKEMVESEKIDYTNLVINDYLIEKILFDVQYFPTSFIVDENGRQVGETIIGGKNYEYFSKLFEDLKQNK